MSQTSTSYRQPVVSAVEPTEATGSLNDLLRLRLGFLPSPSQATPVVSPIKTDNLLDNAVAAVEEIFHQPLNKQRLDDKLGALFTQQQALYLAADIPSEQRKRQYVGRHGLVMSPDHCMTTQKDGLRVRAFIRAIDQAISQQAGANDQPLHIVYPACGPLAPLLLPLVASYQQQKLYSPEDLQVTLIDLQPGAIASLQALTQALHIEPFIRDTLQMDGCEYQPSSPVHLVVLEAMQHGFSREGHMALARHFARMLEPGGALIPREVSVRAVINEGQQEYIEQWREASEGVCGANQSNENLNRRINLGELLNLTAESLRGLEEQQVDEYNSLIACNSVTVPAIPSDMQHPLLMICTHIVAGDYAGSLEIIDEYDSGITHPLPDMQVCINFTPTESKPGDLLVNSGDRLKFFYRLNGLPGFLPVRE